MDTERIKALLQEPRIQRKIFKDYHGGYSIGIGANPQKQNELVVRIRIEGKGRAKIPSQITLAGETIPVIVTENFVSPEAEVKRRVG